MLGNYLHQTASADDIFRCIFFLGALRVNLCPLVLSGDNNCKLFRPRPDPLSLAHCVYYSDGTPEVPVWKRKSKDDKTFKIKQKAKKKEISTINFHDYFLP